MLNFDFHSPKPLHVLCLGAHCDDIEIGCGGTLLRLIQQNRIARVDWIVFSSNPTRAQEAMRGADCRSATSRRSTSRMAFSHIPALK